MTESFQVVFDRLRDVLKAHAGEFRVAADTAERALEETLLTELARATPESYKA
jgi:hypothetical protein